MDFLLEMADEGGVRHLIDLLNSRNLAVAESALLLIDRIRQSSLLPAMRHFLKHGIIESLIQTHAPHSSCLFQRIQDTFSEVFCWRTTQSAIPDVVRCLLSLDRHSRELVLSTLYNVLPHGSSDEDAFTRIDPSIPRHLLRLARHMQDSHEYLFDIKTIICWFIFEYSQSREEYRAAGAASFLENYRLSSRSDIHCDNIRRALRLLGRVVDW